MAANIRIRMYRTGFGDCFLLSFGAASAARHVLLDFGAHAQGEIGTMDPIMDDIESTTGRKLELLVATHAHRDHIRASASSRTASRNSRSVKSGCLGRTTPTTRRWLRWSGKTWRSMPGSRNTCGPPSRPTPE